MKRSRVQTKTATMLLFSPYSSVWMTHNKAVHVTMTDVLGAPDALPRLSTTTRILVIELHIRYRFSKRRATRQNPAISEYLDQASRDKGRVHHSQTPCLCSD